MGSAETRGAGASRNALNSPTRSANLEDRKRRYSIVGRVFRNSPGQIHLLCWSSSQEVTPQGREIHPSASRRPAITASVSELISTQVGPFSGGFMTLGTCRIAPTFRRQA